jgi:membrane peptidoglycan carboxypeptidase
MGRMYSASPAESFFTGGGLHTFSNFDPKDNGQIFTVRDGFHRSSNLVFIRLMRDIVHHYYFKRPGVTKNILRDEHDPMRHEYLRRFADREGREYLARFYGKYKGLDSEKALELLTRRVAQTPLRLTVAYRSARPEDSLDVFEEFLDEQLGEKAPAPKKVEELYRRYGADKFNLQDRGWLTRLHPLELWIVQYLHDHPDAAWDEVARASTNERQEIYHWLLVGRKRRAQDLRLRMMIEVDAFAGMHDVWKRHGYPFANLVPSYATAIGSSGDNPAALAELAGIIINGGVRYPAIRVEKLHFAQGTPMETTLRNRPAMAERAMPAAVAAVLKQAMRGVVEFGTARRAFNSVKLKDGAILPLGAKTGTGDNRFETYGTGGGLLQSKVVNRTAAFVFTIGDKYYGTIIAYAPGEGAAAHHFTSALPVSIFKTLVPTILPLLSATEVAPARFPVHQPGSPLE